ncbi:MAG: hypothetical protein ABSF45_20860 [Terriglobia bacterium]|jgi:tRNA(Ile2) C34 agmatinyltransferase TiaS
MTIEKHHSITLDEIVAYEFRCGNPSCGARMMIIAATGASVPGRCPQCGHTWLESSSPEAEAAEKALKQLLQAFANVVRLKRFLGCELYLQLRSSKEGENAERN